MGTDGGKMTAEKREAVRSALIELAGGGWLPEVPAGMLALLLVPDDAPAVAREGSILLRRQGGWLVDDDGTVYAPKSMLDEYATEADVLSLSLNAATAEIAVLKAERNVAEADARTLVAHDRRESRDHTQPGDWLEARRRILARPVREG